MLNKSVKIIIGNTKILNRYATNIPTNASINLSEFDISLLNTVFAICLFLSKLLAAEDINSFVLSLAFPIPVEILSTVFVVLSITSLVSLQ
jgi:hypothetical protein